MACRGGLCVGEGGHKTTAVCADFSSLRPDTNPITDSWPANGAQQRVPVLETLSCPLPHQHEICRAQAKIDMLCVGWRSLKGRPKIVGFLNFKSLSLGTLHHPCCHCPARSLICLMRSGGAEAVFCCVWLVWRTPFILPTTPASPL